MKMSPSRHKKYDETKDFKNETNKENKVLEDQQNFDVK